MEWKQGNWNAFVIIDCKTREQSRKKWSQVPEQYRESAANHAGTFWDLQERKPPTKSPVWPCLEMTPIDLEYGEKQLALVRSSGKTAPNRDFGDLYVGFAAERVVDRWLNQIKVDHIWNNDPTDPKQDFEFGDILVDLKAHPSKGGPRRDYDANLNEKQRRGSGKRDWYLFAKLDNTNMSDLWVLGFQTEQFIMENGVFYRKGEITRKKMKAKSDCWNISYGSLIKPHEWLNTIGRMK